MGWIKECGGEPVIEGQRARGKKTEVDGERVREKGKWCESNCIPI